MPVISRADVEEMATGEFDAKVQKLAGEHDPRQEESGEPTDQQRDAAHFDPPAEGR